MFFGIPEWAIGVGAILMFVSVLKVVTARLMPPGYRGRSWRGEILRPETEDLQARLAEVDQLKQRVSELEERVDFAERLLARHREGERLPP
jgi:Tfp pilus assembly protein PilN